MRCPFCGHTEDKVVDSRTTRAGEAIRRRRECLNCGKRFTTYERLEELLPRIIKRDGSREDYERQKIEQGLKLACSKRPIATDTLDAVVARLEQGLLETGEKELDSEWIGAFLSRELRQIDLVAYIRFASVYRGFEDVQEFLEELRELDPNSSSSQEDP
ncbi:MAG: transcriptional regulator NrdR [Myxococcota bacterium]